MRLRTLLSRTPELGSLTRLAALFLLVVALGGMLSPMLSDFSTYGFHDWDVETAYRYITVLSLKEYGEGPWWHPWLCGGAPGWGYVEGASNLVSPYLPLYLLADIRAAIRLEVVGQALLGLAGAYLFAGTLSKSVALRTLLAVLWVLNGRWALQAAVGHTWHLQYALMPWAFYLFERACEPGQLRRAVYVGLCVALLVYWGGIYPLPQTALLLSLYALLVAAFTRKLQPLLVMVIAAPVAVIVSGPKLFAVLDRMQDVPRLIESKEVIGLAELLVMLTDTTQRYGSRPVRTPAYNWHEWGIYVGVAGVALLSVALIFGRGPREYALKILGLSCVLLGFGAFHEFAPWTLLHELPVFSSQHVPSRFHYPMLLMLGAVAVATLGRWLEPALERRPWLDLVLLVPVALFAFDLVKVSRVPFTQAFWMEAPSAIQRAEHFEHELEPPVHYVHRDWAAPMLLSMMANTGVIKCYGVSMSEQPGARAKDRPGYAGPAHIEQGEGKAEVVEWTPNRARVRVSAATPGALVVYNMNYDPSWRANGEPALEFDRVVAHRLQAGETEVEFSYFPRTLPWSLPLALLALGACFVRRSHLERLSAHLRRRRT